MEVGSRVTAVADRLAPSISAISPKCDPEPSVATSINFPPEEVTVRRTEPSLMRQSAVAGSPARKIGNPAGKVISSAIFASEARSSALKSANRYTPCNKLSLIIVFWFLLSGAAEGEWQHRDFESAHIAGVTERIAAR